MLGTDELRAWYGPTHVAMAVERGAVGTLLISDDLFRFVFSLLSHHTYPFILGFGWFALLPQKRR